jgi:hypothetical protein
MYSNICSLTLKRSVTTWRQFWMIENRTYIHTYIYKILTPTEPDGWWIIILEWGRATLIVGLPAASNRAPMLHAWPTHQVEMGTDKYCIVS